MSDELKAGTRLWTPARIVATLAIVFAIAGGGYVLFSSGPDHADPKAEARLSLPGTLPAVAGSSTIPEDYELPTVDGRKVRLSDYKGKVLVVDFWATWCAPCRQEIPQLVRIADHNRTRGLEVIGLHIDDDGRSTPEAIKQFVTNYEISYTVAMASNKMFTDYLGKEESAIPQTLVFNRDGRLIAHFIGYTSADAVKLETTVNQALTSS